MSPARPAASPPGHRATPQSQAPSVLANAGQAPRAAPPRAEAADADAELPSAEGDRVRSSVRKATRGWRGQRGRGGFGPTARKARAVAEAVSARAAVAGVSG